MWPLFNLRLLFYCVWPTEFNYGADMNVIDSASLTIPYSIALIVLEILVQKYVLKNEKSHDFYECLTSLSYMMLLYAFKSIINVHEFNLYNWIYEHYGSRFLRSHTVFGYFFTLLVVDLSYYWFHRWNHEVPLLYKMHRIHHSSKHFNMFSSMRSTPVLESLYAPYFSLLAFFIPTEQYFFHKVVNNLYPLLLHTEIVPKIPVFSAICATPLVHKIHHGNNKLYRNSNYGSVFVLWDKLFGTYQEKIKSVKIECGFTATTYNVIAMETVWIQSWFGFNTNKPWMYPVSRKQLNDDTSTTDIQRLAFAVQFATVGAFILQNNDDTSLQKYLSSLMLIYHLGFLMDKKIVLSRLGDILNRVSVFLVLVVSIACCNGPYAFVIVLSYLVFVHIVNYHRQLYTDVF